MIEALIAGERDPRVLAELARGRMRVKRAALVEALTGRFDDHHAELARMLLDQIDALTAKTASAHAPDRAADRRDPRRAGDTPTAAPAPRAGTGPGSTAAVGRRASRRDHRHRPRTPPTSIIAESRPQHEPVPHRRPPRLLGQALPAHHPVRAQEPLGQDRQGQPLPQRRPRRGRRRRRQTDTFLGERYRRLVKRRGKLKALVAVARSILVIVWHLLADPTARYHDLGADFYASRINKDRKTRDLVRQLEALGTPSPSGRQPDPYLHPRPAPLTLRRALPRARIRCCFPVGQVVAGLRPGRHRPGRVGDPVGPRPHVQRGGQAADPHGQHFVGRGHPRAAVHPGHHGAVAGLGSPPDPATARPVSARTPSSANRARSAAGSRK